MVSFFMKGKGEKKKWGIVGNHSYRGEKQKGGEEEKGGSGNNSMEKKKRIFVSSLYEGGGKKEDRSTRLPGIGKRKNEG